ncbi:MAG: DEAD/DEAH box helicase family protein [Elusimicrobiota bacterium]|nr:MAG: DEAD/DEAH box helicase family protein [Elusimicrobiota bacterium]
MIRRIEYQDRALESLKDFLSACARGTKPAEAFESAQKKHGAPKQAYRPLEAEGLNPSMPAVCLRVPTGGGKTLMACRAAGVAITDFLRAERGIVLWLVPSTAILDQTADALRDARHPYRRALELSCGNVEVLTIDEALRLSRATADGATVVIVATMQAFKSEETADRRVYKQNGHFSEHLLNMPAVDLMPGPDGKPVPSLVNALRLRRPVVIVDEAHNAGTPLSFSALADVRPSCVIEFTATPDRSGQPSNVLHQVSAAELKAADMAKLPVRVVVRDLSQRDELLAEAVTHRRNLHKLAEAEGQATGEYIRPMLLIQAESVAVCEDLKKKLVAEFQFAEAEVKISVGGNDELADAGDLRSPKCPVLVVITVQRLREGWDCPFAYVLCSLQATRSATAIQQIVGRILRLPGAKAKTAPDLNCAYVFSVSPSIGAVLNELRTALVANGFTPAEAGQIIKPAMQGGLPLSANPQTVVVPPKSLEASAETRVAAMGGKAAVDTETGTISVFAPLEAAEVEALVACVKTPEAKAAVRSLAAAVKISSPWERNVEFSAPMLCVKDPAGLFEFEETCLKERLWKLSGKDASLPGYDPKERPKGRVGALDVSATGQVTTDTVIGDAAQTFLDVLHRQITAMGTEEEWGEEKIVAWLDWRVEHRDILAGESAAFMLQVLRALTSKGAALADIAADRFRLKEFVERRIEEHRRQEHHGAFQAYLDGMELVVDPSQAFDFRKASYEPSWLYSGAHNFRNHYYGAKPGELEHETGGGKPTEEFLCAQHLDDMPEVEFWFRNLARKPGSFRLLTPDGWFYPDFVGRLKDGRTLVVEYKGAHLLDGAKDKLAVGTAWAKRGGGVFVMPTQGKLDAIDAAIKR